MRKRAFRILIVDDSPEDRETYRRYLSNTKDSSYEFTETDSGEEGLRLCRTVQPDCVLLDYKLPEVDGLYWLHRCQSGHAVPEFAIVMLTGQGDELVAVEALKSGAQDYLVKSRIAPESLSHAVHKAIEEVHEQRQQSIRQAELERQATTDSLTELLNRRAYLERLEQELSMVHRYRTLLSVLMIDVDHFKKINDQYGHLTGDHVLKQVGKLLKATLRSSDLAGRYGGEEFSIMAANTDLEGARVFAERIRKMLERQEFCAPGQTPFSVTCSIGVAEATAEVGSIQDLIGQADEALYRAKRQGRNQVCLATGEPVHVH